MIKGSEPLCYSAVRLLVAWCLCDEVIVWYGRVLVVAGGTFVIEYVLAWVWEGAGVECNCYLGYNG